MESGLNVTGSGRAANPDELLAAMAAELRQEIQLRQKTEHELHLSRRRFERLSSAGVVGVVIAERDGRVLEANDTYLQLIGYTNEDLALGRVNWRAMMSPEALAITEAADAQLERDGAAGPFEMEHIRKDGSRVSLLVSVAVLHGSQVIAIVNDLTARNAALAARQESEERLREAQKLEAIGILADGVVHDFNNLLSVILSYSGLLISQTPEHDERREDLIQIRNAATRAADLAHQLVMFGRRNVIFPHPVRAAELLSAIERMVRPIVGEDIEFVVSDKSASHLMVDPATVEQAVMNLVANARDAMPAGGSLTLEADDIQLDAGAAALLPGLSAGPHVVLTVTDSGIGMSPAVLENVFKPFFTTKKKSKGTGLGLSTALSIVKQNKGAMTVSSALGRGTSFRLYFPSHHEEQTHPRATANAPTGTETILLVEDDNSLRAVERTILQSQGYKVLDAHNAGEALLISERTREPIHVLLSDVVMPFMSGTELAVRLRSLHPELRVLFASGYTVDVLQRHGLSEGSPELIRKPITPEVLALKVRQILDRPSAARAGA